MNRKRALGETLIGYKRSNQDPFQRIMIPTRSATLALALAATATSAGAQQQLPPIRQLGTTVAKSSETFMTVTAVRQLPGGRVLVNDPIGRRVLMNVPVTRPEAVRIVVTVPRRPTTR